MREWFIVPKYSESWLTLKIEFIREGWLSLFTPMLRTDSTRARFGRNWAAFNSPSWLGEGWRERPVRAPNSAYSLRRVLLPALRKSFTRDNRPSPPGYFHPSAGAAQAAWGSEF